MSTTFQRPSFIQSEPSVAARTLLPVLGPQRGFGWEHKSYTGASIEAYDKIYTNYIGVGAREVGRNPVGRAETKSKDDPEPGCISGRTRPAPSCVEAVAFLIKSDRSQRTWLRCAFFCFSPPPPSVQSIKQNLHWEEDTSQNWRGARAEGEALMSRTCCTDVFSMN